MILPIYIYGQPVLRKVAEDITPDYPELKQLIADMWETLAESEGIGLAAPQIGRAIRLSVIDLDVRLTTRRPTRARRAVCRCLPFMKKWCVPRVFMWSGTTSSSIITTNGLRAIWLVSCNMSSTTWTVKCLLTISLLYASSSSRAS